MKRHQDENRKTKINFLRILKHVPVLIWCGIVITPLIMLLFISFKTTAEFANTLPITPPKNFLNFDNYIRTLIEGHILASFKNSFLIVFFASVLNVLMGSMTAYCLDRFDFPLKKQIKSMFIVAAVIPNALLQVAIYKIMVIIGLVNTLNAPILLYSVPSMIQVWIYLQFFEKIPVALDESAMIDGASYLGIFIRIIFPLLAPATATVLITQSIMIYNDMFTQYLYCPSSNLQTVTTALMAYSGQFATSFNVMAAGCVSVMIPTVILYLILKRYIFAGLTVGAIKQ